MKTKHTSGPWLYRPTVNDNGFYIETVDKSHQKTFIGDIGGGLQSRSEIKSNAKLIAAAPELLETLIEVLRISDRNHIAWINAKRAIKKATE